MGWGSAGDIVDPQVRTLVDAVESQDITVEFAKKLLSNLIEQCQQGDWDTEDETLEQFIHVSWVVEVFKKRGVELRLGDKVDLKDLIKRVIDSGVAQWYDLGEDFWRDKLAEAIADAVYPKVEEWA